MLSRTNRLVGNSQVDRPGFIEITKHEYTSPIVKQQSGYIQERKSAEAIQRQWYSTVIPMMHIQGRK